jgi:hypothetical protein
MPTQGLGPALLDGCHRFQMTGRDATFELVAIGRTVLAKNLDQLHTQRARCHGKSAIN